MYTNIFLYFLSFHLHATRLLGQNKGSFFFFFSRSPSEGLFCENSAFCVSVCTCKNEHLGNDDVITSICTCPLLIFCNESVSATVVCVFKSRPPKENKCIVQSLECSSLVFEILLM